MDVWHIEGLKKKLSSKVRKLNSEQVGSGGFSEARKKGGKK